MQRLSSDRHVTAFRAGTPFAYQVQPGSEVVVDALSGRANPATGPIELADVRAGDWVAVRIDDVVPVGIGHVGPTQYAPHDGRCVFLDGRSVTVDPNIGVIGVLPSEGETTNDTCGPHGGNLDCRDHGPGATAFFRAQCDGAGLAFGDVHWAMGDGEVEGQGIEGAAELHLGLFRAEGVDCEWPWLIRNGQIMAIGGSENFKEAVHIAYEGLISLVSGLFGHGRRQVQDAIGPAGHVRICQCCCRVLTVRCTLPLELLGTDEPTLLKGMIHT